MGNVECVQSAHCDWRLGRLEKVESKPTAKHVFGPALVTLGAEWEALVNLNGALYTAGKNEITTLGIADKMPNDAESSELRRTVESGKRKLTIDLT